MTEDQKKEMELIIKVEEMQAEQAEYFKLKRQYGGASQQLEKCKKIERELKKYVAERRKALTETQKTLF